MLVLKERGQLKKFSVIIASHFYR